VNYVCAIHFSTVFSPVDGRAATAGALFHHEDPSTLRFTATEAAASRASRIRRFPREGARIIARKMTAGRCDINSNDSLHRKAAREYSSAPA
jgi:hypothetical protein